MQILNIDSRFAFHARLSAITVLAAVAGVGCGMPFQAREHVTLTAPLPAGKLVVENVVGEVFVRGDANCDELRAELVKIGRGATQHDAQAALDAIDATLASDSAESDTIFARARHPKGSSIRGYEVQWRIVAPPTMAVDVHNRVGNVDVDSMHGGGLVQTDVGDVTIAETDQPFIVRTEVGNVTASRTHGAIDVRVGTGAVQVREARGAAKVRTNVGDVKAEDITGGLTATTSTGDIRAVAGGPLNLNTSVGNVFVRIRPDDPGAVSARTSTGSVHMQVPRYRQGRLVADTDIGSINIRLDNDMSNVRHHRKHFEADLNGGISPTIDLNTDVGDVRIESYGALANTPSK